MLANLYLHEFDRWVVKDLGRQFDLRYFRYADDFVILTRCEADSRKLYEPVASKLRDPMLLEIHPLRETADSKTRISVIARGDLEFVGFHFMEDSVRAKRENIQRFKKRFLIALDQEHTLKGGPQPWTRRLRQTIRWCVNPKITGPEPEICANCGLPKERQRSWVAFFASVVSDVDQLRQLDRWMRQRICKHFWEKYGVRLDRQNLRKAGMKTLVGQYYRVRQIQNNLCKCEHDSTPT